MATLCLLIAGQPMASVAQSRTPAEYMAAIEGAQASAGENELGDLTLEDSWRDSACPA